MRGQSLIQHTVMIAALGSAAAVALPRLVEWQSQARTNVLRSVAASAGSAMMLNYVGCVVTGQVPQPGRCSPVNACSDVDALLHDGVPEGYRIEGADWPARGAYGTEVQCKVVEIESGATGRFSGIRAGGG